MAQLPAAQAAHSVPMLSPNARQTIARDTLAIALYNVLGGFEAVDVAMIVPASLAI